MPTAEVMLSSLEAGRAIMLLPSAVPQNYYPYLIN